MDDTWDFYLCEVEGKPASVLVDMGAAADAPDASFPRMGYVSVFFSEADANGFPFSHDYEALAGVEDSLAEALAGGGRARYVGRCILDGRMDCVFYASSDTDWEGVVAAALEGFSVFDWESGIHDEADWNTYLEFLYPGPADMVEMQNRRALSRLEEMGDDLEAPRSVEHWVAFASAGDAGVFGEKAQAAGFLLRGEGENGGREGQGSGLEGEGNRGGGQSGDGKTRLCLRREDAPALMDEVSLELFALAALHGGEYEGWSCAAITPLDGEEDGPVAP